VLAFDGSNYLAQANATLEELVRNEGLSARRASVHAQVALGLARMKSQKLLSPPSRAGAAPRVTRVRSKPEEARKRLDDALEKNPPLAAETLGHIDFNYYTRVYAEWLAAEGERRKAENVIASAVKTLRRRKVIPAAITQLRGALKRT
jgi:hypothetical protein